MRVWQGVKESCGPNQESSTDKLSYKGILFRRSAGAQHFSQCNCKEETMHPRDSPNGEGITSAGGWYPSPGGRL